MSPPTEQDCRTPFRVTAWFWSLLVSLLVVVPFSSLYSQPALPPNQVLHLDGDGGYVELPTGAFTNLDEATIECWIRWDLSEDDGWSRVFDFGERNHEIYL